MKHLMTILAVAAALAGSINGFAQEAPAAAETPAQAEQKAEPKADRKAAVKEELKAHFKPYGFFRTYGFYDSRATKALTEDLFLFIPLDSHLVDGADINAVNNFGYQALTTRLGLDVKDYKIGNTAIEGRIEADFYCLNSGGNVATLRMRQAYMKLSWNPS